MTMPSFDLHRTTRAAWLLLLAAAWPAWAGQGQPAAAGAGAPLRGIDCLIEPRQVVELRSPVEGIIERVLADRGSAVRKGQVLVELESSVERSNVQVARQRAGMQGRLEQAQKRVEFAGRKLERAEQLLAQNFLSSQARDEAHTEKQLADAELRDAQENQVLARLELRRAEDQLALRSIRSPFDGHVVDRLLNPGDLAEAGTGRKPLLKLAQIDTLRVEAVVPQDMRGRFKAGATVLVRPEGTLQPVAATVVVVDKVMDAASGLLGVRLELNNARGQWTAGARCSVELPARAAAPQP
jgi:RND family efflux transporter MFP subunit